VNSMGVTFEVRRYSFVAISCDKSIADPVFHLLRRCSGDTIPLSGRRQNGTALSRIVRSNSYAGVV